MRQSADVVARCRLLLVTLVLVDDAEQGLVGEEAAEILRDLGVVTLPEALGDSGSVRRDQAILKIPER